MNKERGGVFMKDELELGGGFYLEHDLDASGREVVYFGTDDSCFSAVIDKEKASEIVLWLMDKFKLGIVGRVTIEAREEEE